MNNYRKPVGKEVLVLMTEPNNRPYSGTQGFKKLRKRGTDPKIHYCFVAAPYGVIPVDLAETYPLSQFEMAKPLDHETIQHTVKSAVEYVEKYPHKHLVAIMSESPLDTELLGRLGNQLKPENLIRSDELGDTDTMDSFEKLLETLK